MLHFAWWEKLFYYFEGAIQGQFGHEADLVYSFIILLIITQLQYYYWSNLLDFGLCFWKKPIWLLMLVNQVAMLIHYFLKRFKRLLWEINWILLLDFKCIKRDVLNFMGRVRFTYINIDNEKNIFSPFYENCIDNM